MPLRRKPLSQTWREFVRNHTQGLVSIDFFVVQTATSSLSRWSAGCIIATHDTQPEQLVAGLLRIIENASIEDMGTFLQRDGSEHPS